MAVLLRLLLGLEPVFTSVAAGLSCLAFMPEQHRSTVRAAPVDSDDNRILLRVVLAGKQPGVDEVAVAGDVHPAVRSVHEGADRGLWEEEPLQPRSGHNSTTMSCATCILFLPCWCLHTSCIAAAVCAGIAKSHMCTVTAALQQQPTLASPALMAAILARGATPTMPRPLSAAAAALATL